MDKTSKRILIAPLDWGLGHLSRCVPLVRFIRSEGHEVIFAGNAAQCTYIQSVFGEIKCLPLQGYEVRYARSRGMFMLRLLAQLPRLWRRIRSEHRWLEAQLDRQHIDAVISDNRYGLYSRKIPCVLVTHQLRVLSGRGNGADRLLQKLHYRFIAAFGECWVPDLEKEGISGRLGHPAVLPPVPVRYIGLLSQCSAPTLQGREEYLLVLLSGTEPQRSILSRRLWQQVCRYKGNVVFVEGSDEVAAPAAVPAHITWYGRVAGEKLHELVSRARLVICRSGYSSVMDLLALHKRAILVPTPGQTEQEYLADIMQQQRIFYSCSQENLELEEVLAVAESWAAAAPLPPAAFEQYRTVLAGWLGNIGSLRG